LGKKKKRNLQGDAGGGRAIGVGVRVRVRGRVRVRVRFGVEAEPAALLPEEVGVSDAAGVHRVEDDARLLVEPG